MPILPAPVVQRTREGHGDRTGRPELFAGLLLRLARATQRFARRVQLQQQRRRAAGQPAATDAARARLLRHVQAHVATVPRRLGLTREGHAEAAEHPPGPALRSTVPLQDSPQRDRELLRDLAQVRSPCRRNSAYLTIPCRRTPICAVPQLVALITQFGEDANGSPDGDADPQDHCPPAAA